MNLVINRQHSNEAEQALIALFIDWLDNDQVRDVFARTDARDFYHQAHADIFTAIGRMVESGSTVDLIGLMQVIPDRKPELIAIAKNVSASRTNVEVYFAHVREKAIERNTQIVLHNALDTLEMDLTHNEKIDRVNAVLKDLDKLARDRSNEVVSLKEHLRDVVEDLGEREQGLSESIKPLQTGYLELDALTGGFGKGELVVIGARTSVGKSAFGQNVAENIARQTDKRVLYITMEMTGKDLAVRAMCSLGRVDNAFLRNDHKLSQEQWANVTKGVGIAGSLEFYVAKMARPTVEEVKTLCRSFNRTNPVDIIVIDHLHLMSHKKTLNEVQGIGDTTAELKGLALELEVPILLMAQLNRGNAKENRPPTITDLRGSGAIEQDSDRVVLLHRTPELDKQGIAKLLMVKNRGGKSHVGITLKNNLHFYRFDNGEGQYAGWEELADAQ